MRYADSIIFLVGARASGKTSAGEAVAASLGWLFMDTDVIVQTEQGMTVAAMVDKWGWEHFRACESLALRQAATRRTASAFGVVVATGGGMVLHPENRAFMRRTGTVFYLHAPAALLAERLAADPQHAQRPSLTGRSLPEEMEDILRQRDSLYRETAHHVLDAALPPEALAAALVKCLQGSAEGAMT